MRALFFCKIPATTNPISPSMYRTLAVLTILAITSIQAFSQKGSRFPQMVTEDINEGSVKLPDVFDGRYALVGLAMTKKAEEELRTWQIPVYNKFVAKTGMMDAMFNVAVYFIPVFTGAAKAAKGKVVKKLKENNERLVNDHLLIYSGDQATIESLQLDDRKAPYFFLVEPSGKIVWMADGPYRQKYLEEVETVLSGGN